MVAHEISWLQYIITGTIGFVVGFINVMAGAGSILSLPLLIFLGLPANVANGTNRISILLLNIVGVSSYLKSEKNQKKLLTSSFRFVIPSLLGAIVGVQFAVKLDEALFKQILGVLLIFFFFVILYKPRKWIEGDKMIQDKKHWWQIPLFFVIGMYGGFIQLGAGIFLLMSFVLGAGYDLLRANIFKIIIILAYTPFVLFIFIKNQQVDFLLGGILGIGSAVGAYVGSRFAKKRGAKFIRYVLLIVIIFSAAKFLGAFQFIGIS